MPDDTQLPPLRSPLPELLRLRDGTAITTQQQWQNDARPELLELFRTHVYGHAPVEVPQQMSFEVIERAPCLNATAEKLTVLLRCGGPCGEATLPLYIYLPLAAAHGGACPTGCLLFIAVKDGSHVIDADTSPNEFWPVADILARNYATAAIHKDSAAPDNAEHSYGGIFTAYETLAGESSIGAQPAGEQTAGKASAGEQPAAADTRRESRAPDAWGAIAAWSWCASRAIDYLKTLPALRTVPLGVIGHSRGGKAALWCGAQDERVALAVSNNSGNSGAALSRSTRGESISEINKRFPYWFSRNYRQYSGNEAALPVDQHQLIALMAPRLAYVTSASEDAWADPQSEFQGALHASPAFGLYGQSGLVQQGFPATDEVLHEGRIGYHIRKGGHDLLTEDWNRVMDFADRHWR